MISFKNRRYLNKAKSSYLKFEDEELLEFVRDNRADSPFGVYFNKLTDSISSIIQIFLIRSNPDFFLSYQEYKIIEIFSLGKDACCLANKYNPELFKKSKFSLINPKDFILDDFIRFVSAQYKSLPETFNKYKLMNENIINSISYMLQIIKKPLEFEQIKAEFKGFLELLCNTNA